MKHLEPGTIYKAPDNNVWVAKENRQTRFLSGGCDGDMYSGWDDNREILGRLPPDQLNATEWRDEYRLPPKPTVKHNDLHWNGSKWVWENQQKRIPLTPGLVIRFRSGGECYRGESLLVIDIQDFKMHKSPGPGKVYVKPIDIPGKHAYFARTPVCETDDIEVLGQIPIDQLYTATKVEKPVLIPGVKFKFRTKPGRWNGGDWKQVFTCGPKHPSLNGWWRYEGQLPYHGAEISVDDDIEIIQSSDPFETEPELLPIGTKFRFRSWPERWKHMPNSTWSSETEFYVEPELSSTGGNKFGTIPGEIFNAAKGVLPTDDIETLSHPEQPQEAASEKEASPFFTWRGWEIYDTHHSNPLCRFVADKPGKGLRHTEGNLNALLDRIAEAEGLNQYSIADLEQCRKHLADEHTARIEFEDTAMRNEVALEQERTAREKAEKAQDVFNTSLKTANTTTRTWRERHEKLKQAFRAATGQDYEPGRDYSKLNFSKIDPETEVLVDKEYFNSLTEPKVLSRTGKLISFLKRIW